MKIGLFDIKSNFFTLWLLFQMRIKAILICLMTFFRVKQPVFANIKQFLSFTQKCKKKLTKTDLTRKSFYFKIIEEFLFKICYEVFKTNKHIVLKNRLFIFWNYWEITRQRASVMGWLGSGRAEPVHQGYRLFIHKETFLVP